MRYRLIYFDVDGTLVDDRRHVLASTREALGRANAAGIGIGLATGRKLDSALPHAEAVGADAPLILFNGARIQEPGTRRVLAHRNLPLRHALRALRLVKGFDIHCNVYVGDELYIESVNPTAIEYMAKDGVQAEEVGDMVDFLDTDPVKLLLIGEGGELEAFRRAYVKGRTDLPTIVRSEPTYLEILAAGTCKGSALVEVSGITGVSLDRIVAFGDNLNDVEMIEVAGLGVAMGNAHPDLKAVADVIAGTNETDAIAEVIDRLVLV